MALIKIIKQEHAQALSNRVVIFLAVCLVMGSISLVWATISALLNASHPMLALLTITPLGTGLGHYVVTTVRYCRPDWFKPEQQ